MTRDLQPNLLPAARGRAHHVLRPFPVVVFIEVLPLVEDLAHISGRVADVPSPFDDEAPIGIDAVGQAAFGPDDLIT
ncbi:MAG: hypothetical protein QP890_10410 [Corynebacterium amycolatum]|nr:hypothetical protein [Corynebacterium amycolatum]MDK8507829.1 hypothetical protein [Corynebacterium amycolatum]